MAVPFSQTKKEAISLWGRKAGLVKVYVPASRGFIRAQVSGNYWIPRAYALKLKLKIVK